MPYEISFSEDAERQLDQFTAREQRIIVKAVEEQLAYQPSTKTRARKHLRENPLATWELRVEDFRVLYNVDETAVTVFVAAIAIKDRSRYMIEGKEYPL